MSNNRIKVILFLRSPIDQGVSIESIFNEFVLTSKSAEVDYQLIVLPKKITSIYGFFLSLLVVLKSKGDVYYFTSEDVFPLSIVKNPSKVILHCHDYYYVKRLKSLKKVLYRVIYFHIPFFCSKTIITVSNSLREEISNNFRYLNSDTVVVVYNFLLKGFHDLILIDCLPDFDICLIGTKKKKQVEFTLSSLQNTGLRIVVLGEYEYSSSNVVVKGLVSLDKVKENLLNSKLMIFMSEDEGFGLPIIEAQACGAVVVCSDIPVFREVAGSGALFVGKERRKELSFIVRELLNDNQKLKGLQQAGYENCKRFTFQKFEDSLNTLIKNKF